jgi:hypothetical protein
VVKIKLRKKVQKRPPELRVHQEKTTSGPVANRPERLIFHPCDTTGPTHKKWLPMISMTRMKANLAAMNTTFECSADSPEIHMNPRRARLLRSLSSSPHMPMTDIQGGSEMLTQS